VSIQLHHDRGPCSRCGRTAPILLTNSAINAIGRANLDGSGANQVFITGAEKPQGVTVDSTHIYWANSNSATIARANLDGSGVNQFFLFAGKPERIAVDSAHVWWTNGAPLYSIGRANLDGTGVSESFIAALSTPAGVAVNALATPSPGPGAAPPTITGLVADVQGLGLPRGTERSLLAKLGAAQRNLDAGGLQAACGASALTSMRSLKRTKRSATRLRTWSPTPRRYANY
jgi:hypothetical protein